MTAAELSKGLVAARSTLVHTLGDLRTDTGWRDITGEIAQDHWTNVNVSSSLLGAGNANEALAQIVSASIQTRLEELTRYGGFLAEGNRIVPNANLTGDSGIFMVRFGDLATAQHIARHVLDKQLENGAWSIALIDATPRVRATSQILRFLFELRTVSGSDAYDTAIKRGLGWLMDNNVPGTTTWSNVSNDRSPNLSATTWVLTALVNAAEAALLTDVGKHLLDGVASDLIRIGEDRAWIGTREDSSVASGAQPPERVGSGAASLTFFVPAYWRYVAMRRVATTAADPGLRIIFRFVNNLQRNHRSIGSTDAIDISEEGAATFTYNLGFALEAITAIEFSLGRELALGHAEQLFPPSHAPLHEASTVGPWQNRRYIEWLGWFGFVTLALYQLAAHSAAVPRWYQARSSFTQGLIMAFASVIIASIAQLAVLCWKSLKRRRSDRLSRTSGSG